jgi:hypothetical protein
VDSRRAESIIANSSKPPLTSVGCMNDHTVALDPTPLWMPTPMYMFLPG